MATLPLAFTSTRVVASKRSSTCAVPEFSGVCRRTSISVPEGISIEPADAAAVEDDGDVDDAWVRGATAEDTGADEDDEVAGASPRARERRSSMRSRTS